MRHTALIIMLAVPLMMSGGGRPVTPETRPGHTCTMRQTGLTLVDVETGVTVKDPCIWWVKSDE